MKNIVLWLLLIYLISCKSGENIHIKEQTIGKETFKIVKIANNPIFLSQSVGLNYESQIVSSDGKYFLKILRRSNRRQLFKYDIFQEKVVDSLSLPNQVDSIFGHYILMNSRDNNIGLLRISFNKNQLITTTGTPDNPYEMKHDLYILNSDLDSLSSISLSFPNNHIYENALSANAYYMRDSNVYIIKKGHAIYIHNLKTQTVRYAESSVEDSIFDIINERFYLCDRFEYIKQYDAFGKESFFFKFGKDSPSFILSEDMYHYLYDGLAYVSNKDGYLIWDISKNDTSSYQKIVGNRLVNYWFKGGIGIEKEDTLTLIYKQNEF